MDTIDNVKLCNGCGKIKPLHNFYIYKNGKQKGQIILPCKQCHSAYSIKYKHTKGIHKPMSENKECASYLGVVIAEKALLEFYNNIKRMPYGNPGFDFECDRLYKIDIKSSCLYYPKDHTPCWTIHIRKNIIANYFLCLLFNNRKDLTPMYVLLIPGKLVNNKVSITIPNSTKSLAKWNKFMKPLDSVINCCNKLKEVS